MDRLSTLLSFAIMWIAFSYLIFTEQQYFSLLAGVAVLLVALASAFVFVDCYRHSESGILASDTRNDRKLLILLFAVSVLVLVVLDFDAASSSVYTQVPTVVFLALLGVAVSIAGLYGLGMLSKLLKHFWFWVALAVCVVVIASVSYEVMYGFRSTNWGGIDELGYNYYASYLFFHGTNPYTASMKPILQKNNIFPTVQLSGSFEYAYDYPALSFLPYIFMPIFGISSFFVFIFIVLVLSVFAAYIIYKGSGYNRLVLIPLGAWLFVTYTLVGTMNQYLSVSVLFLIAYMERKRFVLSGVLLGLSASVIQLSWFAIPFLYILIYKEHGGKHLAQCVGITILVFLLVNGYFIIISPNAFIENVFGIFLANKLVILGPNVMQLFDAFYPVSQWYAGVVSVVTLLSTLVLFYIYPKTLKLLIAVVPIMIFFLSWRNISIYGLPFLPLVIAIYYMHDKETTHDLLKSKRPIIYTFSVLIAVFLILALVSHGAYSKEKLIGIGKITPILYGSLGTLANGSKGIVGPYSLGGLKINVINRANYTQPISFYVASRNPNGWNYILNNSLNVTLPAHSSYNYTVPYRLQLVNNGTRLYIQAFSQYYKVETYYRISLAN
ncbi:MAG: hypothetical protein ACHQX1_00925 [Candidatus Micrarchaeales archaeon]